MTLLMYRPAIDRYQSMSYARCGRSGLHLPRISLGLWQNFGKDGSFENAREMVLKSFDAGVTHFDLANNYGPPPGSAEENFGRILATDLAAHRDELIVSTKAGYLMWAGPYGEWGSRNTCFPAWIKVSSAWGWITLTFSIPIASIRKRRSKKR